MLVSEFTLSKGKEAEESWAFRGNKETQLSKCKGGGRRNQRGKMRQGPVMEGAKGFADNSPAHPQTTSQQ